MQRRTLGRTGLNVPALGLGGVGIGGTLYNDTPEAEGIETVQLALERGVNLIDTSPLYGDSERRIGLALKGIPRESYTLTTKTGTHPNWRGDYSRDGTLFTVENSLKLLGTDFLDVCLIHDPDDLAPVLARRGALETLEELRAQGVVRHIGMGVRSHSFLTQAIATGRFDVILTYNDYHVTRTTAFTSGLLQRAEEASVGVLNGSPMGHGLLAGGDPRTLQTHHLLDRDRDAAVRLYDWCRSKGIHQRAIVLQSCLRQPLIHCTLTGASTREELLQNLDALDETLPDALWQELAALKLTEGQV